jgi:hypothetical protein
MKGQSARIKIDALFVLTVLVISTAGINALMAASFRSSVVCPQLAEAVRAWRHRPIQCPIKTRVRCIATATCTDLQTHAPFKVCTQYGCR